MDRSVLFAKWPELFDRGDCAAKLTDRELLAVDPRFRPDRANGDRRFQTVRTGEKDPPAFTAADVCFKPADDTVTAAPNKTHLLFTSVYWAHQCDRD